METGTPEEGGTHTLIKTQAHRKTSLTCLHKKSACNQIQSDINAKIRHNPFRSSHLSHEWDKSGLEAEGIRHQVNTMPLKGGRGWAVF